MKGAEIMKWESILNEKQLDWLNEVTERFDIISTTVHGSHLYGLNREGSDVDIKVIYVPSFVDMLMGDSNKTYNKKNDELDIEVEIKSLTSFLKSASKGDTNCVDIIHTPVGLQITTSPVWEELKILRSCLYAKDMRGMLGYIKTHTSKYSNKIDRFNEMNTLMSIINKHSVGGKVDTVADVCFWIKAEGILFKYIKESSLVSDHEQSFLEVCGKKYTQTWKLHLLTEALDVSINTYGNRTDSGSKKGMDTKSLSHALRVLYEIKQITEEGELTFPLKESEYILKVKVGDVEDREEVNSKIHDMYEECIQSLEDSSLPQKVDVSPMVDLFKRYFIESLKG